MSTTVILAPVEALRAEFDAAWERNVAALRAERLRSPPGWQARAR